MKNSAEFNIDLNAKDNDGWTAFHWACFNGHTSIIKIMISKSESLKLNLTARANNGKTVFQLAQDYGKSKVVNLIKSKMPIIAF